MTNNLDKSFSGAGEQHSNSSSQTSTPAYIYHTLFGEEFRSETAEEAVSALYENTRRGWELSFEEWWAYQDRLWSRRYGDNVPDKDSKGAYDKLLSIMVKRGALEKGPLPQHLKPQKPGDDNG